MAEEITVHVTYSDSKKEFGGKLRAKGISVEWTTLDNQVQYISLSIMGEENATIQDCGLRLSAKIAKALAHTLLSVSEHQKVQRAEVSIL